jgi:hypothetical protein
MLVAGIGTELMISGYLGKIIEIHHDCVLAEIIEGVQIGRVVPLSFKQVEAAAGLV